MDLDVRRCGFRCEQAPIPHNPSSWTIGTWNALFLNAFFWSDYDPDAPVSTLAGTWHHICRQLETWFSAVGEPRRVDPETTSEALLWRIVADYARQRRPWLHESGEPDHIPSFIAHLFVSCVAATEGDDALYATRLQDMFESTLRRAEQSPELNRRERERALQFAAGTRLLANRWKLLAQWILRARGSGYPLRPLHLPDPGGMTRIGFSRRLSFPCTRDHRLLIDVLSGANLSSDALPVEEVLDALRRERRWTRSFVEYRDDFFRRWQAKETWYEEPFWEVIRRAAELSGTVSAVDETTRDHGDIDMVIHITEDETLPLLIRPKSSDRELPSSWTCEPNEWLDASIIVPSDESSDTAGRSWHAMAAFSILQASEARDLLWPHLRRELQARLNDGCVAFAASDEIVQRRVERSDLVQARALLVLGHTRSRAFAEHFGWKEDELSEESGDWHLLLRGTSGPLSSVECSSFSVAVPSLLRPTFERTRLTLSGGIQLEKHEGIATYHCLFPPVVSVSGFGSRAVGRAIMRRGSKGDDERAVELTPLDGGRFGIPPTLPTSEDTQWLLEVPLGTSGQGEVNYTDAVLTKQIRFSAAATTEATTKRERTNVTANSDPVPGSKPPWKDATDQDKISERIEASDLELLDLSFATARYTARRVDLTMSRLQPSWWVFRVPELGASLVWPHPTEDAVRGIKPISSKHISLPRRCYYLGEEPEVLQNWLSTITVLQSRHILAPSPSLQQTTGTQLADVLVRRFEQTMSISRGSFFDLARTVIEGLEARDALRALPWETLNWDILRAYEENCLLELRSSRGELHHPQVFPMVPRLAAIKMSRNLWRATLVGLVSSARLDSIAHAARNGNWKFEAVNTVESMSPWVPPTLRFYAQPKDLVEFSRRVRLGAPCVVIPLPEVAEVASEMFHGGHGMADQALADLVSVWDWDQGRFLREGPNMEVCQRSQSAVRIEAWKDRKTGLRRWRILAQGNEHWTTSRDAALSVGTRMHNAASTPKQHQLLQSPGPGKMTLLVRGDQRGRTHNLPLPYARVFSILGPRRFGPVSKEALQIAAQQGDPGCRRIEAWLRERELGSNEESDFVKYAYIYEFAESHVAQAALESWKLEPSEPGTDS